jgi:hypothetical protein
MFENKKIAHALVYDKNNIGLDEEIRKNLKVFYKRNLFIDSLKGNPPSAIIENSIDNCIINAFKQNFDFLIVTWEGNIFDIYDFHHAAIENIKQLELNGEWVVAGHIIDQYQNRLLYKPNEADTFRDSYFLFPITAFINLQKWGEIGKPRWGDNSSKAKIIKALPSSNSVHDGYTPLHLTSLSYEIETSVKTGWNIINESLKNNIPVHNIDVSVRKHQTYLYPENDPVLYNRFWNHLLDLPKLNDSYSKLLNFILPSKSTLRIKNDNWSFFLRNTEEYWPKLTSDKLPTLQDIDCVITPCSGFKDFILSQSLLKVESNICIIHYDILKPCIDIKKRIIDEWDGTKEALIDLLEIIKSEYSRKGKDSCFHMNAMKTIEDVYEEIKPFFSSDQLLLEKWREFQNFQHFYFNLDILNDINNNKNSLLNIIQQKNVYLCLSDVAGWRINLLGYRVSTLRSEMSFAISSLIKNTNGALIDYKDPATDHQYLHNYEDALKTLSSDYEI